MKSIIQDGEAQDANGTVHNYNTLRDHRHSNFLKLDGLYDVALKVLKKAAKKVEKTNDEQAMQQLVRAFEIVTSKEVTSSPTCKQRNKANKFFSELMGDLRKHNNEIKHAEKVLSTHFETFLKAKHNIQLTSQLEEKFYPQSYRCDVILSLCGIKKAEWQAIKNDMIRGQTMDASNDWADLITKILNKIPQLKTRQNVEDFLLGRKKFQHFFEPKTPQEARIYAQIDTIEALVADKPQLQKEWLKAQTQWVNGNNKAFYKTIHSIVKKTKNKELQSILSKPYTFKNDRAYRRYADHEAAFENTSAKADRYTHTLSKTTDLNLNTVALDSSTYIASAAPRKQNAEAYFEQLEKTNTRIIVDLTDDSESRLPLLPQEKGQEVTYGKTKITLLDQKSLEFPHQESPLTESVIEVRRDGTIIRYKIFHLHGWEKDQPAEHNALRILHNRIVFSEDNFGPRIAAFCTDGGARTSSFLLSHHLRRNIHQKRPLEVYLQYSQHRPTKMSKDQYHAAVKAATEPVRVLETNHLSRADQSKAEIGEFLFSNASSLSLFKAFWREDIASVDQEEMNYEALVYLNTRTDFQNKLDVFFEGLSFAQIEQIRKKILTLNPDELDHFLTIITAGNYKQFEAYVRDKLNLKHTHPIDLLISHKATLMNDYPKIDFFRFSLLTLLHIDPKKNQTLNDELNKFHLLRKALSNIESNDFLAKPDSFEEALIRSKLEKLEKHITNFYFSSTDAVKHLSKLTPQEIPLLGKDLVKALPPSIIHLIPPEVLANFSNEQLSALKPEQTAKFYTSQWMVLSNDGRQISLSTKVLATMPKQFCTVDFLESFSDKKAFKILSRIGISSKSNAQQYLKNRLANYPTNERDMDMYYAVNGQALKALFFDDIYMILKLCQEKNSRLLLSNLSFIIPKVRQLIVALDSVPDRQLLYPSRTLLTDEFNYSPQTSVFKQIADLVGKIISTNELTKAEKTDFEDRILTNVLNNSEDHPDLKLIIQLLENLGIRVLLKGRRD